MRNKKAISATILMLVVVWLLIGLTNLSAENIPISEGGLERIGLNKIRLESGIGVIVFNLSESYNRLEASGYLTVSNTYNSSVTISCRVITKLSTVDLDEDGLPRIHTKISDNIIFKSVLDGSWITLEDDEAVVNPYSIYNFRYTVDILLDGETVFDNNEGYLVYINIRQTKADATGVQIGINYNYKLFLIFTGELEQGLVFSMWMLLPIPFIAGGILFVTIKQKTKKAPVKKEKKVAYVPVRLETKPDVVETDDVALLHQKIDKLTRSELDDTREVSWGRDM